MNRRVAIALTIAAVMVGSCIAPLVSAKPVERLGTRVVAHVGYPPATDQPPTEPLLRPAMLVVLETQGIESAARMSQLQDELKAAYRLARLELKYQKELVLKLGAAESVPPPAPGIGVSLKLVAVDDQKGTYAIRLGEAGKEPVETTIAVLRGSYSIIGGRNGPEAPYLFLFVRPATLTEEAEEAKWEGKTKPKAIHTVQPKYPEAARKAGLMDVVVLELALDAQGAVTSAKALQGKVPELIEAAKEAALQWKFEPAKDASGKPFAVTFTITLVFKLQ